jgi:hypothetical protein
MAPVEAGLAVLYALPRDDSVQNALMAGYYLLSFLFGGNPLVVSWIVANTAGQTKKSVVLALYNAASSVGNIVGPLLFNEKDAPAYQPGLRACLGIFVAMVVVVLAQWGNLVLLNKTQGDKRVANGKPRRIVDQSMQGTYEVSEGNEEGEEEQVGGNGFLDLTDRENDEFVYIY